MRVMVSPTCVCSPETWSSPASGETTYTSSYFRFMRLLPVTAGGRAPVVGHLEVAKDSVSRVRGLRVVNVHHLEDAVRGEHLGGVGRPGDEPIEIGLLVRLELR